MPDTPASPTNTDQLRHAIDRGVTGDKVDFSDPAAAPLGTDEEAAGTPVSAEDVAEAYAHEAARPSTTRSSQMRVALIAAAATAISIALIAAATVAAL